MSEAKQQEFEDLLPQRFDLDDGGKGGEGHC